MSRIVYKNNMLKYKSNFLQLKGNVPNWYTKFELELNEIYNGVYNHYDTIVLTGSGAIAYLLKYLDMETELDLMESNGINPHDLDFLYVSTLTKNNPDSINQYNINPIQKYKSSVTFTLNSSDKSNYTKSFDVSKVNQIKSSKILNINVINLNSLK